MAGFFSLVFVDKTKRIRYTVYVKQERTQDIVFRKTAFRNWWNSRQNCRGAESGIADHLGS